MTTPDTTSSRAPNPPTGLLEWLRSLLRRLLGSPAAEDQSSVSETYQAPSSEPEAAPAPEPDGEVIIAPGGFRIQVPRTGQAEVAVNTTSFDDLLPDVRQCLTLLPPLPSVVLELLKEIQRSSSSAASVAEIAASDPSLAASLLRTVNSAAFGLSQKVTGVSQAVSLLGFGIVKSLVVKLRLKAILPHHTPQAAIAAEDLWAHSLAVSYIAGALAARIPDVDRGFISTLGLLHDIGRLAICSQHPDPVAALRAVPAAEGKSLLQREAVAFGADHAAVGAMLGNRWQLPADLTKAIRWHHSPANAFEATDPEPLRKAVYLVQVADQLAKYCFAYDDSMEIDLPAEGALKLLGLRGSMEHLLSSKVRAAATQAILLAEENSKRPLTVVRPFLNLRRGNDAADLTRRLQQAEHAKSRISVGDAGIALFDNAERTFQYDSAHPGVPAAKDVTSARYTARVTPGAAEWLAKTLPNHWQALSIPAKDSACARTTLRAMLPNLVSPKGNTDVAWQWDGSTLQLAIRSPVIAFSERLPAGTTPDTCLRVLEAELANILNLGWFDVETSADGATINFRSR